MKYIFTLLFCVLFFNTTFSQEQLLLIGFYKVKPGMEADYETAMIEYQGKMMKERVKNGCLRNWVFREVLPNSEGRKLFTHMTVDVLNLDSDTYNCSSVTPEKVFPEMSENMRNIINKVRSSSREVVYRTVVRKVAGVNKGEGLAKFAAFNFIKTKPGKKQAYINRNKEFSPKQYKNYSNQQAWYAWERYDARVGGLLSWDYLSMDGYNKISDKLNRVVNTPKSIKDKENKKYGPLSEMRDLNHQVLTRLLFSAK